MPWNAQDRRRHEGEEAARTLTAAVEAADDEAPADGLEDVEPRPPRGARARVDGRDVVVSWQPVPGPAGPVTYRVVRRTGRAGTAREVAVGELSGTEITDTEAPVGTDARYAVVAVHGGRGVSEPVETSPVTITPEVCDLRVRAGEASVTASWQAPAEAVRVDAWRREGAAPRGPGDGVRVETDGAGFRDRDVRPDAEYFYRVRAVYLTSNGHARASEGLVRRATPGPPPPPVLDLAVSADGGTGVRVHWTRPPRGRVVLRVGPEPSRWEPGAVVGPDEAAAHGPEAVREPEPEPVPGPEPVREGDPGPGRERAELLLGAGISHVLAVTVAGDRAVVGRSVRIATAPPVGGCARSASTPRSGWGGPGRTRPPRPWSPGRPRPLGAGAHAGTGRVRERAVHPAPVRGGRRLRGRHGIRPGAGERPHRRGDGRRGGGGRSRVRHRAGPGGDLLPRGDGRSATARTRRPPGRGPGLRHARGVRGLHRGGGAAALGGPGACPGDPALPAPGRGRAGVGAREASPGSGPGWLMCFPAAADDDRAARLRQPSVKELRL
ncbi:fibronectin type III domain-containing protein [Nocardiopsis sp. ARC36]